MRRNWTDRHAIVAADRIEQALACRGVASLGRISFFLND